MARFADGTAQQQRNQRRRHTLLFFRLFPLIIFALALLVVSQSFQMMQQTAHVPAVVPKPAVPEPKRLNNPEASSSVSFNRDNPFQYFSRWTGTVRPRMTSNHESLFLGVQTNCTNWGTFRSHCAKTSSNEAKQFPYPPKQDDHFFEWSDMIAAMLYAPQERFHMLELGAGWAKWITDAAFMTRQLHKRIVAIGVEAQPDHCLMADWHLRNNQLSTPEQLGKDIVRMICAPVGEKDGPVDFPIDPHGSAFRGDGKFGYGIQMLLDGKTKGVNIVKLQALGMCTLLKQDDFQQEPVDFVSLDVQSFEHAILNEEAVECMNTLTRLVHISLHRVEANDARPLAERFLRHGWKLIRYNPLETRSAMTHVGKVGFTDGRLTFINPRLTPPSMMTDLYDERNIHLGSYTDHEFKSKSPYPDWAPGDTMMDLVKKYS